MNQIKVGSFLQKLRKEKKLTQEKLAEQLDVSNRTVSRWETGSNLPDLDMLVVIADFYNVSIPEIINGERKGKNMNQEVKATAVAMAEYGRNKIVNGKKKAIGISMVAFGLFIIISALTMFPSESSWGSIYATLGSIILIVGFSIILRPLIIKRSSRIAIILGGILLLFGIFSFSDYVAVKHFHQVPRFRYETIYDSGEPNQIIHKTLFFTAIQQDPGTENEDVFIK